MSSCGYMDVFYKNTLSFNFQGLVYTLDVLTCHIMDIEPIHRKTHRGYVFKALVHVLDVLAHAVVGPITSSRGEESTYRVTYRAITRLFRSKDLSLLPARDSSMDCHLQRHIPRRWKLSE